MKKFWNGLLSNLGLGIMIGGVAYLAYIVNFAVQTNLTLAIATGVILGGFMLYIILNKLLN